MSTLKVNNILSQQGTGNVAISFGTDDSVTFTNPVSQPGAFMFRNKIINGNFDIWQRATSQTSSGYGSADRWFCGNSGSTKTASRQSFTLGQTDVPGNPKYFMRHVVTSSAGASNYVILYQPIESVNTFAGQTVTVSFWAKADASKNIAIEFYQNFGTGGSPSTAVSGINSQLVALTTSWTKYTITVNIPSVSGKTLGTNNDDWMGFIFWFDAGSSFNSRSASLGQQSGTFDIAEVQLEEGSVATPFEQRHIGMELSLCQRYYHESKNVLTLFRTTSSGNFGGAYLDVRFVTEFRITPTLSFFTNTVKTTSGILVNGTTQSAAYNVGNSSTLGFAIWNNGALASDGVYASFYYTASAEL
jgi:hypothetical protein